MKTLAERLDKLFRNAESFLNKFSPAAFFSLLSTIWLLWRFLTLDMVEKGGDAVWKWRFLRYIAETGNSFPAIPDHHMGRWAVLLPQLGLFKLTGTTELWTYYPLPLLYGFLCGWLLYLLIRKLSSSRLMGTTGFLICMIHPLVARESTQFAIMLPCAVWTLAGLLVFLRYKETGKQFFLPVTTLCLFLAWGCKVTSLFWIVIMGVVILFSSRRKIRDVLLFWGVFILLLLCETMVINRVYGLSRGRLDCILAVHVPSMQTNAVPVWFYLFSFLRPLSVWGKYFDFYPRLHLLIGGLCSGYMILRYGKKRTLKQTVSVLFFMGWIPFSYAVCSLRSILYAEPTHGRYYITLVLIALILILCSIPEWNRFLQEKKWKKTTFLTLLFVLYIIPAITFMFVEQINHWQHGENILRITEASSNIRQAKAEQLPVLCRFRKGKGDGKYAVMWGTLLLPAEALPAIREETFRRIHLSDGKEYTLIIGPVPEPGCGKILFLDESFSRIASFPEK